MLMLRRQFLKESTGIGIGAMAVGALPPMLGAEGDGQRLETTALDLQPVVEAAMAAVRDTELASGVHQRWLGGQLTKRADGALPNPYGSADAANILYTLGHFPRAGNVRDAYVSALRSFQEPDGLFQEATHHPFHVTAHCAAALELFDAASTAPLTAMHPYLEEGKLETFLERLAWQEGPWNASHQGAGLYASLVIAREAPLAWEDRYFAWLAAEQDPVTGFWRKGAVATADTPDGKPLFHHLAGSFHYLFNHEYARRPLPHPEALVDSCLRMWEAGNHPMLKSVGFAEIDWVYCLTRARRQCGHRFADSQKVLTDFAVSYGNMLLRRLQQLEVPFDDLHRLFGAMCCLAELQTWLPGIYRTERPLKLVLDRRPFI